MFVYLIKHSFECLIWLLKALIILGENQSKTSQNFMIIWVIYPNLLHGIDFLCFLFMHEVLMNLRMINFNDTTPCDFSYVIISSASNSGFIRVTLGYFLFLFCCCGCCFFFSENNNLLLTEREGRTGEYWPEVVALRTERSKVCMNTTKGQYSLVWLEQAKLVSSLLYGTLFFIVQCSPGGLHLKMFVFLLYL